MHEIDMVDGMTQGSSISDTEEKGRGMVRTRLLFSGSQREAWIMASHVNGAIKNYNKHQNKYENKPVILKTLLFSKDFSPKKFDLQRLDALATERLTASPYVVNTFGFCGMSVLNEFADGGDLYHGSKNVTITSLQKMIYSRDSELGLADIHGIDGPDHVPTLMHRDIRSHNFLLVGGQLKYHDFNNAQVLAQNTKTGKYCGFARYVPCGVKESNTYPRSPEECSKKPVYVSEKADVYELGVFWFKLLAHDEPYKFEPEGRKQPLAEVREWILDENRIPQLPEDIGKSHDPAVQAIIKVMRMAMTHDHLTRPSARKLAIELVQMTNEVLENFQ